MNSTEFVNLAARLANGREEVEFRTSVSRAYYGAFHAAVTILSEAGISLPIGPESHQKIRFCLMECGEPSGLQAGAGLHLLRKQRNVADYDLQDSKNVRAQNALAQVQNARVILDLLDACRKEPARTRFRAKVRDYAANVLRLAVSEV